MLKISDFYRDKKKSVIPKTNIKFAKSPTKFFFQPLTLDVLTSLIHGFKKKAT